MAAVGFVTLGLSGPFLAFATDLPGEPVSWHGLLHGIGFLLLMLGAAVAMVASGLALRSAAGWNRHWVYSLLNVPLAIAVFLALSTFGQVSFYRLVTVLLTWFAVMGLRLRQLASTTPPGF